MEKVGFSARSPDTGTGWDRFMEEARLELMKHPEEECRRRIDSI